MILDRQRLDVQMVRGLDRLVFLTAGQRTSSQHGSSVLKVAHCISLSFKIFQASPAAVFYDTSASSGTLTWHVLCSLLLVTDRLLVCVCVCVCESVWVCMRVTLGPFGTMPKTERSKIG